MEKGLAAVSKELSDTQQNVRGGDTVLRAELAEFRAELTKDVETKRAEEANARSSELRKLTKDVETRHVEQAKSRESELRGLSKDLEARQAEQAKLGKAEFKEEIRKIEALSQETTAFRASHEKRIDSLAESMSALSGPLTELSSMGKRFAQMEDAVMVMDRRMDAEKDSDSGKMSSVANRLNIMEKVVKEISSNQDELEKRVAKDNEQLQRSLGQVAAEKKLLEAGLAGQREKMSELIKEMRNL